MYIRLSAFVNMEIYCKFTYLFVKCKTYVYACFILNLFSRKNLKFVPLPFFGWGCTIQGASEKRSPLSLDIPQVKIRVEACRLKVQSIFFPVISRLGGLIEFYIALLTFS